MDRHSTKARTRRRRSTLHSPSTSQSKAIAIQQFNAWRKYVDDAQLNDEQLAQLEDVLFCRMLAFQKGSPAALTTLTSEAETSDPEARVQVPKVKKSSRSNIVYSKKRVARAKPTTKDIACQTVEVRDQEIQCDISDDDSENNGEECADESSPGESSYPEESSYSEEEESHFQDKCVQTDDQFISVVDSATQVNGPRCSCLPALSRIGTPNSEDDQQIIYDSEYFNNAFLCCPRLSALSQRESPNSEDYQQIVYDSECFNDGLLCCPRLSALSQRESPNSEDYQQIVYDSECFNDGFLCEQYEVPEFEDDADCCCHYRPIYHGETVKESRSYEKESHHNNPSDQSYSEDDVFIDENPVDEYDEEEDRYIALVHSWQLRHYADLKKRVAEILRRPLSARFDASGPGILQVKCVWPPNSDDSS